MKKAIILFNLGGPDSLDNVEPFLFNLFNDPAILNLPSFLRFPLAKLISKRRAPTAKKIYQELGGSSPILKLTEEQSKALEQKLNEDDENSEYKSFIVMRCWHPRAENVIKDVKNYTNTPTIKPHLTHQAEKWLKIKGINIKTHSVVFVHFRRGDYLYWPSKEFPAVLSLDWYKKAMSLIKEKIQNPIFILISDDNDLIKQIPSLTETSAVVETYFLQKGEGSESDSYKLKDYTTVFYDTLSDEVLDNIIFALMYSLEGYSGD